MDRNNKIFMKTRSDTYSFYCTESFFLLMNERRIFHRKQQRHTTIFTPSFTSISSSKQPAKAFSFALKTAISNCLVIQTFIMKSTIQNWVIQCFKIKRENELEYYREIASSTSSFWVSIYIIFEKVQHVFSLSGWSNFKRNLLK